MKKDQIDVNTWELMAADHPRNINRNINQATATFETNHLLHEAQKRQRRKERRELSQHLHVSLPPGTSCPHYNKFCKSRTGPLSHVRLHDRHLEDVIVVSMER